VDVPNTLVIVGNCGVAESSEPGGGVAVSARPPTPLTASDPAPEQGRPVSGLSPVLSPVRTDPGVVAGVTGEIGISVWLGMVKAVIGLKLLELLCADALALAAAAKSAAVISFKGLATMTVSASGPRDSHYTRPHAKETAQLPCDSMNETLTRAPYSPSCRPPGGADAATE
jgi:hypothetical protein